MDFTNYVCDKIKENREECGYSKDFIADALGVTVCTVTSYEGTRVPTILKLNKLATLFNKDVADFLPLELTKKDNIYACAKYPCYNSFFETFSCLSKENKEFTLKFVFSVIGETSPYPLKLFLSFIKKDVNIEETKERGGSDVAAEIGFRLQSLRLKNNLKQIEVADFFGVQPSTYVSFESGERLPNYEFLIAFADKFGVSLADLIRNPNKSWFEPCLWSVLYEYSGVSQTKIDLVEAIVKIAQQKQKSEERR